LNKISITSNEANQRLDRFLRKYLKDTSLSEIYKMLRKKTIRVNGVKAAENYRLSEGDVLEIYYDIKEPVNESVKESSRDFSIIHEDENILIVHKPSELILHPDIRHRENTLVDQVLYYLYEKGEYNPEKEKTFRPAAVNRLDVNTGGIVLFAKNYPSLQNLNTMIKERYIEKYYICVVKGNMEGQREVKAYLAKDEKINKVKVSEQELSGSKVIHTRFSTIRCSGQYSLLEVNLITGRSHQIRAQLASLNHPIIGDMKYGDKEENAYFKKEFNLSSQFLYAYKVHFNRAEGNMDYMEGLSFTSKLPPLYNKVIQKLFNYNMEIR